MIDQLMRSLPIEQLSAALGTDDATTRQAVQAALPALLGGLHKNSEDQSGAQSLLEALGQHHDGLDDGVNLDRVDTNDGEKILGHVFGNNTDGVVNQLGGMGGGQLGPIVRRLLPILAPIVLSWLARQVTGAGQQRGGGAQTQQPSGGSTNQPGGALGNGPAEQQSRQADNRADQQQGGGLDMTSILQEVLGSALGGGRR
ncbi:DUF937 domain-containing protein [Ornithinimicrobium sp. Y1847]|uniref:DUF937 domain-containing protein n=1 Tax=Ornithinimicrobium sp. Y1847 TaxID=3405419 RepID=UPI003B66D4CA